MEILVRRSSDKVATIRAKALANIATIVQLANANKGKNEIYRKLLEHVGNSFVQNAAGSSGDTTTTTPEQDAEANKSKVRITPPPNETTGLLDVIQRRVQGE